MLVDQSGCHLPIMYESDLEAAKKLDLGEGEPDAVNSSGLCYDATPFLCKP